MRRLATLFVVCVGTAASFSTQSKSRAFVKENFSRGNGRKSTALGISSWGSRGPPSRWRDEEEEADPEKKIQSYLKQPEPVEARSNLDGSVLVSGWVKSKERTDQFVFDLLNHEDSAFRFNKILAFVDDMKFAKKRLLSRSARYTGLLDKLDFVEAAETGALPTTEQLEGVKSWLAYAGSDLDVVKKIGELAKSAPSLENLSVLITDSQTINADAALDAVSVLDGSSVTFTVVAVGAISEKPEGAVPYQIRDFGTVNGTLPANATFSRDESLRVAVETLALKCGENKAMTFAEVHDVNQTEAKLIRGLREGGYTRPQEIDHMISKGPEAYKAAIEAYKVKNPEEGRDMPNWMIKAQEEFEQKEREREERVLREKEEEKTAEVKDIAREWAKREYFRKSMMEEIEMDEEEYIDSVWERAMFEGELRWRQLNGEETDEKIERSEFKDKMEKKKQAMLEKAKRSLKEVMAEAAEEADAVVTKSSTEDDSDDDDDDQ